MFGAAVVTGQIVAASALRDTLFLSSLDITWMPVTLTATAGISLLLAWLHERASRTVAPATLVPRYFALSACVFLVEWALRPAAPVASAVVLFLHVSAAGPLLACSFWTIAGHGLNPRTIVRQLAGAGTLGALLAALAAERIAAWIGAPALLLLLAILQGAAGLIVGRLTARWAEDAVNDRPIVRTPLDRAAARAMLRNANLRYMAILVLLGAAGPTLVEYVFKGEAVDMFGRGDQLLRFFALVYAGINLVTFVLQASTTREILEHGGLAVAAASPSAALLAGSAVALAMPGLGGLFLASASESVLRGSWFRAATERTICPSRPEDRAATRTIIEVVADRSGVALAGLILIASVGMGQGSNVTLVLVLTLGFALAALSIAVALRTNRRGADVDDRVADQSDALASPTTDPTIADIATLRRGDAEAVLARLEAGVAIDGALIPHIIRLLQVDTVAARAERVLRGVVDQHAGQFVDVLLDTKQDVAVRRRLARLLSACATQRVADGLLTTIDDLRFAIRSTAARSLVEIIGSNPRIRIDRHRVLDALLDEVSVGRCVWDTRHVPDDERDGRGRLRTEAGESLAHVFMLLSLLHGRDPVRLASTALFGGDDVAREAALDYLHGAVPDDIRQRLWPYLNQHPARTAVLPRDQALAIVIASVRVPAVLQ